MRTTSGRTSALVVICVTLATACNGAIAPSSSSSTSTGDPDGAPPATPAKGGGVCCPITASAGCSPQGDLGGWAASASDCTASSVFDGDPYTQVTDDHGCPALRAGGGTRHCGEIDPRPPSAGDYGSACVVASDCIAFVAPTCDLPTCSCPLAAIATKDAARYGKDLATYRARCEELHPGTICNGACRYSTGTACCGGVCVLEDMASVECLNGGVADAGLSDAGRD